jgi:hypothetical protein
LNRILDKAEFDAHSVDRLGGAPGGLYVDP